jgi:Leucine-rich repeat (LRR) protein
LEGHLSLEGFTNLEKIQTFGQPLSSLDLTNCAKLQHLNTSDNKLTNLNLTGCSSLNVMNCQRNKFADLKFLSTIPNPKQLDFLCLSRNKFSATDLSCFVHFINLKTLVISENDFCGSLEPLKHLTKLESLSIDNTNIDFKVKKGGYHSPRN